MSQSLSLCMIVKNEEINLPRCLDSVKDYVDEIIIVDTGSTDKTIEIAKQYTNKVIESPWCNDFSYSRNVSLEYATGDWILVLDADEYIENPKVLKKDIKRKKVDAYFTTIRCFESNKSLLHHVDDYNVRLFRNKPLYKYHGIVHEQVYYAIAFYKGNLKKSDLLIHHDGYTTKVAQGASRSERNIAMLHKVYSMYPTSPYYNYQLGLEYWLRGLLDRAKKKFMYVLEQDIKSKKAWGEETLSWSIFDKIYTKLVQIAFAQDNLTELQYYTSLCRDDVNITACKYLLAAKLIERKEHKKALGLLKDLRDNYSEHIKKMELIEMAIDKIEEKDFDNVMPLVKKTLYTEKAQ